MNQSKSSSRWPFLAVISIVALFLAYVSHVKNAANEEHPGSMASVPATPQTNGPGAGIHPAATGPGTFFPSQGHDHWSEEKLATFSYNSIPPTSGPHEEVFAEGYIAKAPLSKAVQVHLLEHGNVLIQYRCSCPALVKKLTALSQSFDTYNPQMAMEMGKAVLISPNPSLKNRIVLTAWTRLLPLKHFDQPKITGFITSWLGNERNSRQ